MMDIAEPKEPKRPDRGTAKFSLQVPEQTQSFEFTDDIDCKSWLTEINLAQYTETFLVNLSMDNKHIRRKRLSQLRQQDFSAMNITNFAHQKRLMEHVRLVLKFPFHSPHRKKEIKDLYIEPIPIQLPKSDSVDGDSEGKSQTTAKSSLNPTSKSTAVGAKAKDPMAEKKKQARRRRSFDSDVWNSISNMRKKSVNSAAIADQLRQGIFSNPEESKPAAAEARRGSAALCGAAGEARDRNRRWSFHGNDADGHTALVHAGMERARAMMYGNMALEYDIMLTSLHTLQTEVLNKFKETLGCEVASLFFVNNKTRELLLCSAESRWYRVPFGVGICGYCMETGENVNIPDAYSDYRFNRLNFTLFLCGVCIGALAAHLSRCPPHAFKSRISSQRYPQEHGYQDRFQDAVDSVPARARHARRRGDYRCHPNAQQEGGRWHLRLQRRGHVGDLRWESRGHAQRTVYGADQHRRQILRYECLCTASLCTRYHV
jgi:hypothetical protein